jgi:hypothetical protein
MKNTFIVFTILLTLISCDINGYGPKIKTGGVEVYYQPDGMKESARSFSEMLDTLGYGKDGDVSFQLVKDSMIHINMVTMEQYHTDESMDYSLNAISLMSQLEIFKNQSVQLNVCDGTFTIKRSLEKFDK